MDKNKKTFDMQKRFPINSENNVIVFHEDWYSFNPTANITHEELVQIIKSLNLKILKYNYNKLSKSVQKHFKKEE